MAKHTGNDLEKLLGIWSMGGQLYRNLVFEGTAGREFEGEKVKGPLYLFPIKKVNTLGA